MKVTATTRSNLDSASARNRVVQTLTRGIASRLVRELEEELRVVAASGRGDDPDARREALAHAVRRHFGTPL
jgi:hypothetical protein